MAPFTLNSDLARAWLTDLVVAHELTDGLGTGETGLRADTPPIGMVWEPRDPGEEDSVHLLVRAAQDTGVLARPAGMTIDFEYIDDGDDGLYRWLLDITTPTPLKLATLSEAMAVLGQPGASGIDAAMAVMREAAQAANLLVQQLSDYVEARNSPGRGG